MRLCTTRVTYATENDPIAAAAPTARLFCALSLRSLPLASSEHQQCGKEPSIQAFPAPAPSQVFPPPKDRAKVCSCCLNLQLSSRHKAPRKAGLGLHLRLQSPLKSNLNSQHKLQAPSAPSQTNKLSAGQLHCDENKALPISAPIALTPGSPGAPSDGPAALTTSTHQQQESLQAGTWSIP